MAIYHLHVQFIQRSKGRSSVASAAYRSATRLYDTRLGQAHSYLSKTGVIHAEVLTPRSAPVWAGDREKLWNAVEARERRRDASVAREVRVALPCELSPSAQVALVRYFAREQFVRRGMVADLAIHHDNLDNPHAHIGLTLRSLTQEGFGLKAREWDSRATLMEWREGWAQACNRALIRAGHEARVDHRSHADRGLPFEPTHKVGMVTARSQDRGRDVVRERLEHNAGVRLANGEAILRDPAVALEAVTAHEATFTRRRLERWLASRTGSEGQREACLKALLSSPACRRVGRSRFGEEVYSSREMLACEWRLMRMGREMAGREAREVSVQSLARAMRDGSLSSEQMVALGLVTRESGQLAVVEGWAGTGKSRLFATARRAWEEAGLRVVGGALSGRAAAGLAQSAGLSESRTLASWEHAWGNGTSRLRRRDVLVIDEASLVGTRQMGRVLDEARRGGAKVVLVGDTRQLQAIEAGSPMRALGQVAGRAVLRDIRRQAAEWQRQASAALAAGRVTEALNVYRDSVHQHDARGGATAAIAASWVARERLSGQSEGGLQVALSHRRRDVAALNGAIRVARRAAGQLGLAEGDVAIETPHGTRLMAPGDRLCFLRNDRRLGVHNGTTGTVLRADRLELKVLLDEARCVVVPLSRYKEVDHGYALTVHRSQGVTVRHVHVWATPGLDRHGGYVALTRHRESVSVHVERGDFADHNELSARLSRAHPKGMALSFVMDERGRRERARAVMRRREVRGAALETRRELLVRESAVARAAAFRLQARLEAVPYSLEEAVSQTRRVKEATFDVEASARMLGVWERLGRQAAIDHGVRARLGLLGRMQVTSPQTGSPVRLDGGLKEARSRHLEALNGLRQARVAPEVVVEAQRSVNLAQADRPRTQQALYEARFRAREAEEGLRALNREHSDTGVAQHIGLHSETGSAHSDDPQTRLQIYCRSLERLVHRLDDKIRGLEGAGRSQPVRGMSLGVAAPTYREASRLAYLRQRRAGRKADCVSGLRARLARASHRFKTIRMRAYKTFLSMER